MRLAVALPTLSPRIGPGEISDRTRETGLAGDIRGTGGVSLSTSGTGRGSICYNKTLGGMVDATRRQSWALSK